ncbi:MAG TPA: glycosyltransferase family A protein [Pyrinomonadaceae bacterium]
MGLSPKVSVIITTHNRPRLLPRAIESAQRAGASVEVVVVDDASTDETAAVCRDYSEIRYVRVERNRRVAGARNLGVAACGGEYVSFLDDDDARLPGSLDIQAEALDAAADEGFVYGQVLVCDQDGTPDGSDYPRDCPRGDIFWQLLERNFIPCASVLFRKSCLYRVGLLDESIPGVDDWDLWIRIAELYKVAAVEKPVAVWRRPTPTSGQGSSRTVDLIALSTRLLRRRWLKLPRAAGASRHRRRAVWRAFSKNVSEHLVWEATTALADREVRRAASSALTAMRLHPAGPLGVARRWARVSTLKTLLTSGHGAAAKADFKRTRSSGS